MKRVSQILKSKKFNTYIQKLNFLEKDRKFCKHGIDHSLDVARISYIKVLEQNLKYDKEVIYIAALLHDLGRVLEYEKNVPHNIAGVKIAEEILKETNFSDEEKILIINAILKHRKDFKKCESYKCEGIDDIKKKEILKLSDILNKSDKESRCCFLCTQKDECYWEDERKNKSVIY